jgi:hypothetical protein
LESSCTATAARAANLLSHRVEREGRHRPKPGVPQIVRHEDRALIRESMQRPEPVVDADRSVDYVKY